mgnify:CR=1 FL=1
MSEFVHEPPVELDYEHISVTYKNGTRYYEVNHGVSYQRITCLIYTSDAADE